MELWDVYDSAREKTGRTMVRGEKQKPGDYHLVIHICLFNQKGEMLIQQRQPFKQGWSNMWDITLGGSAVAGETSQMAATRELEEELGYHLDFTALRPVFTINFEHGFDDYYLVDEEVDISKLTFQYEEVQAAKWASKEEILQMIDNKTFIPYQKDILELMFKFRNCSRGNMPGAHELTV